MTYAKGTSVSVERSRSELEKILAAAGAGSRGVMNYEAERAKLKTNLAAAKRRRVDAGDRRDAVEVDVASDEEAAIESAIVDLDRRELADLRALIGRTVNGAKPIGGDGDGWRISSDAFVELAAACGRIAKPSDIAASVIDAMRTVYGGKPLTETHRAGLAEFFMMGDKAAAPPPSPTSRPTADLYALLRRAIYFGQLLRRTGDRTPDGWLQDAAEALEDHRRGTPRADKPTVFSLLERGLYIANLLHRTGDESAASWRDELMDALWPEKSATPKRPVEATDSMHWHVWANVFGAMYGQWIADGCKPDEAAEHAIEVADQAIEALARARAKA